MGELFILARILFLLFSFFGYFRLASKHIRPELSIGFVFCSVGSIMFFAGILNILSITAWIVAFTGVVLALLSFRQGDSFQKIRSPGVFFFLIGSIFLVLLLHGSKFTEYDNFSHWAVAPRIMIQWNRFPNFSDPHYEFQSYPLGSSAFIYYFAEIAGLSSEWFQMFAQAILLLGLVSGIFVFATKRSSVVLTVICSVILLCSNISFTDLLVDTLLPLIGLAGIAFCLYYKSSLLNKLPFILPYSVFLISVKNSGIFFVAAIIGLALYYTRHSGNRRIYRIALLFAPFLTLPLWKIHVRHVFPDGLTSKHSMSLANFSSIFQDKQTDDIIAIVSGILKETISFSNAAILLFLIAAVLWALRKHIDQPARQTLVEILALTTISYMIYQIGIIGMYLFSMPQQEAVILAGYDRYHQTVLTFLSGLMLIGFLLSLENTGFKKIRKPSLVVICCIVLLFTLKPSVSYLFRQNYEKTERAHFDRLFEENDVLPGCRYAIIVSEDREDYGYLYYLSNYQLGSQEHEIITDNLLETSDWIIFDYILFFEETETTRAFLEKNFPDVTGPVVNLNDYR